MIIFNGINLRSAYGIRVRNVRRDILPPREAQLVTVLGRHGAYLGKINRKPRVIECEIQVIGTLEERRALARTLAEVLDTDDVKPLAFEDEPDKVYYAVLDGDTNLDEITVLGTTTLKFVVPDPYAHGNLISQTLGPSPANIIYNGTAESKPILTITMGGTAQNIAVACGPKSVTVNGNFQAGDTIVIDCDKNKVTINGATAMPAVSIGSRFFSLVKGDNIITYSANTLASMTVRIDYTERWK